MAPAYFIYLIRQRISIFKMGSMVILVFSLSFLPFLMENPRENLKQILSRLFPFERGLTHSYWAPNIWSFYNFMDLILVKLLGVGKTSSSLTGGIVGVQQGKHLILPIIKPIYTNILSLSSFCITYFLKENNSFLEYVLHSCFAFFMFSYHVHEKAILMMLIPLSLLQYKDIKWTRPFYLLSVIGTWSVFPLLFRREEYALKWLLLILFMMLYPLIMTNMKSSSLEKGMIFLLFLLEGLNQGVIMTRWIHLPFLPLLLTSIYSFLILVYLWIYCLHLSFQ
jgi:alpha-1,3-glucosyltransferase